MTPADLHCPPWIETVSGTRFNLLDPKPEQVEAKDICYALARLNRFTGHANPPISVAAHSANVGLNLRHLGNSHRVVLLGLLHDASEAYLGDCSFPLKVLLPAYRLLEERVQGAILARLGLSDATEEEKALVKRMDRLVGLAETRRVMHSAGRGWYWFEAADLVAESESVIFFTPPGVSPMGNEYLLEDLIRQEQDLLAL